jgi:hypothetical protein
MKASNARESAGDLVLSHYGSKGRAAASRGGKRA